MKKLLVFALILSASIAQAGRVKEVMILTEESIAKTLNLSDAQELNTEYSKHQLVEPNMGHDVAVLSTVIILNVTTMTNQEWTCLTQFVKTSTFFKVSETNCKL